MLNYVQAGWKTTRQHPWIISVLFIYQFVWGLFLYKFIQSIVLPLLHRFPGGELTEAAVHVYLAEGQFQLLKTDMAHSFLWVLLALITTRMIMTPLLNAGIYYSIHQADSEQIRPFFRGVKTRSKPFFIIYCLQMLFTFIPMYWVIPHVKELFTTHHTYESIIIAILPLLIAYFVYGACLRLCSMYIQFGRISSTSLLHSMRTFLGNIVPIAGLSCILLLVSGLVMLISLSVSMIWAGFIAVILYQLHHLIKTFLKLWEISSHYQLWSSKTM